MWAFGLLVSWIKQCDATGVIENSDGNLAIIPDILKHKYLMKKVLDKVIDKEYNRLLQP